MFCWLCYWLKTLFSNGPLALLISLHCFLSKWKEKSLANFSYWGPSAYSMLLLHSENAKAKIHGRGLNIAKQRDLNITINLEFGKYLCLQTTYSNLFARDPIQSFHCFSDLSMAVLNGRYSMTPRDPYPFSANLHADILLFLNKGYIFYEGWVVYFLLAGQNPTST